MIELEHIEQIYNHNHFTLHEVVLNEIGSYVFVKNRQGEYMYANQLTLELFNTNLQDLKGKTDYAFFEPHMLADILKTDEMVFNTGQKVINEERALAVTDGRVRVYRAIKQPIIHSKTKQVIGLIGVSTDITDIVELREKLAEQAYTDELTRLYNRRKIWQCFESSYKKARQQDSALSCIIIDIDHFKRVNDSFGHDFGDNVIVELANIIHSNLRKSDHCGRVGGEEFLIVLNDTTGKEAHDVAERLRHQFLESELNILESPFSLSCGVTQLSPNDSEFLDLYRRADDALYKAKHLGRNQSVIE
ncbi:GGDEF domain-containing protein [Vibrio europaeus]|uniref:sensor domain-containing diguanylate cyclase n=1 Tax=Vibrio europaeus TaxID=300876 RepID=UPI00148C027E|nr:sensor domain-containing diguanylate cyclase [Vibrio europaeus]MDC5720690.1 GGDEF domain-containing protein [Vibrio europaeus]MDC5755408.1 GGDEF domain-containing protein [Vibrio europaeus]MDC5775987.1 GGDEF domain-containing protein [Vibrio europaeus]MDC5795125.1 GGDEF domain-containing protein [Vibrio europaeus]MDC5799696.1 GGDEF domain-containing protein [Vibrio europaeus]